MKLLSFIIHNSINLLQRNIKWYFVMKFAPMRIHIFNSILNKYSP